jgi:hypothetical protein
MAVNKFNIHWQMARVQAKKIKEPDEKIHHVLGFLKKNPTKENHGRVLNWMRMTGLGYKGPVRDMFNKHADHLASTKDKYTENEKEGSGGLSGVSTKDLEAVHKDLKNRKYGFQFKSTPKAHTEYVNKLGSELEGRKNK